MGILITLAASLVFSQILLVLLQCWPQFTNYILLPSCVVVMIFTINLVMLMPTAHTTLRSTIYITLIVIAAVITISTFRNCVSTRLHAIFTKAATHVVSSHKSIIFYAWLYLIFLFFFLHLVAFESVAFWSTGTPTFTPSLKIYHEVKNGPLQTVLCVIIFIQFIWGFFFIK